MTEKNITDITKRRRRRNGGQREGDTRGGRAYSHGGEEERIRTAGRKRPLSKLQPNSSISNFQVPPTYGGKEYY